jgi:predicted nucleotide-binding protein (sugar kinase/HSP70/actin superfamily)
MIKYVNSIQRKKFFKDKKFKEFLRTFLKGMYMNSVEKRLFKPFEEYLSDRKPQNPIALVRQLQEDTIYHVDIEGESGLSIGEAYEFMNGHSEGTCGIYHVGPFGCMHETVATSKIQSLINKKRSEEENIAERIIPYLTGVFGESELPNLEAEMAMFSQKCHTRKELHSKD